MSGEELHFIREAFESNYIAPVGPQVDAFEREFSEFVGSAGAVALTSGTAAIHLALRLLGVGDGDTVFCSTLTFVASANPILYQRACPVFIDSEPESWNMSPRALERAFTAAEEKGALPKAAVVVNLYGQSADMRALLEICDRYGVPVVEDAAESLGATYDGKQTGRAGKFGVYSFNGNKIITTSGGGMLVSDDLDALGKARFLATQARDPAPHYQHSELGFNYGMSAVLAAIGRAQLEVLEERVGACQNIFNKYSEALSPYPGVEFMPGAPFGNPTRWLTVLTLAPVTGVTPARIIVALGKENIEARPVWKPLHLQPLFSGTEYFPFEDDFSFSDSVFERGLCLPSGSSLTEDDQKRVIECVTRVLEGAVKK
ncbi:MAG: DegT/DnrJ/EryC1/StrS family aminotransferase [Thermodesulfobacteriota bacterium]